MRDKRPAGAIPKGEGGSGREQTEATKCPKRAPAEKQRPQDEGKANGHVFFLPAYRFPVFRERVRGDFICCKAWESHRFAPLLVRYVAVGYLVIS